MATISDMSFNERGALIATETWNVSPLKNAGVSSTATGRMNLRC